ncbi:AI-2E family transporter [soil metagenome]
MLKNEQLLERLIAISAVIFLIGACILVLAPFFAPLLWAAIISFCSWGIYTRLVGLLRGRRNIAAFILMLVVLLCVVGPFVFAVAGLASQRDELSVLAESLMKKGMPPLPAWIAKLPLVGERLQTFWVELSKGDVQVVDFLRDKLGAPAGKWMLTIGAATGTGLLQLVLSILLTFFFFAGGLTVMAWLQGLIRRIAGVRGPHLLKLAGETVKGVVYGILGTALVQAVLAGIGFWVAGVPAAGILGFATFFLSVVPMGPGLIWVPAALWLYSQGSIGWAIFIVVWGALVVGSVDNVIKPLLISRGAQLPFIIVLLGVLGGALAFGFLGVFIGPTLLAVGYSVLHDWAVGVDEKGVEDTATPADPA